MSNFIIVRNKETDFAPLLANRNKAYVIVSPQGRIRVGYINYTNDNDWCIDCNTGASGIIFPPQILAYAPINLPEELIQTVTDNCNGTPCKFTEYYKPKTK